MAVSQLDAELVGDPLGHRARRDPARLRVTDQPLATSTDLQADLGQLGGLARPRLAGDDDDLVVADGRGDVVLAGDDGQLGRVRQVGHRDVVRGSRGCTPRAPRGPATLGRLVRSAFLVPR